ncbi:hypothetical protein [Plantactinospora sp. GCM10030261]|uniref:hypothetical protein n=1 Tax=Plantactinospora sp. GCM10030261 TaxID=3273420 RepID=UPI0036130D42
MSRQAVRITNIYGTRWENVRHPGDAGTLSRHLRFGRLGRYVDQAQDQLPYVAERLVLDPARLSFQRWTADGRLTGARLWSVYLPSGQAVIALTLDVTAGPVETIELLEDCYYLDVTVDGTRLESFACERATDDGVSCPSQTFEPERHQIVFADTFPGDEAEDITQKLIYRSDLPYRREFSAITYPAELNRRPGTTVAVGPYVSVLTGQQDYIENCAFVSAAQAVGSWVRLRWIRDDAYEDLRLFRRSEPGRRSLANRRRTLERMANQLGELELELSYSVESTADLEILVPSLRVAGYHNALFDCMGLRQKADTVGRMLQRLDRTIRAELTAIESIERRADDERRLRWAIAVGFLSTVGLPVTLVLAFFGVNAKEVDARFSMFDPRYLPLYLFVGSVVSLGVALAFGTYFWRLLSPRRRGDTSVGPVPTIPRQMAVTPPVDLSHESRR